MKKQANIPNSAPNGSALSSIVEEIVRLPCGRSQTLPNSEASFALHMNSEASFALHMSAQLEGVLAYPTESEPERAILFLGPHPHLGGTMDNNVIRHIAGRAAADGALTLRFNYRGVGHSGIVLPNETSVFDYYETIENQRDYDAILPDALAAAAWLKRISPNHEIDGIAGYSLGAVMALMLASTVPARAVIAISPPVLRVDLAAHVSQCRANVVVGGDPDFAYDADRCRAQLDGLGCRAPVISLPGCDHFFRGCEDNLYEAVAPWLQSAPS